MGTEGIDSGDRTSVQLRATCPYYRFEGTAVGYFNCVRRCAIQLDIHPSRYPQFGDCPRNQGRSTSIRHDETDVGGMAVP